MTDNHESILAERQRLLEELAQCESDTANKVLTPTGIHTLSRRLLSYIRVEIESHAAEKISNPDLSNSLYEITLEIQEKAWKILNADIASSLGLTGKKFRISHRKAYEQAAFEQTANADRLEKRLTGILNRVQIAEFINSITTPLAMKLGSQEELAARMALHIFKECAAEQAQIPPRAKGEEKK